MYNYFELDHLNRPLNECQVTVIYGACLCWVLSKFKIDKGQCWQETCILPGRVLNMCFFLLYSKREKKVNMRRTVKTLWVNLEYFENTLGGWWDVEELFVFCKMSIRNYYFWYPCQWLEALVPCSCLISVSEELFSSFLRPYWFSFWEQRFSSALQQCRLYPKLKHLQSTCITFTWGLF